jgi:hypothetical protein
MQPNSTVWQVKAKFVSASPFFFLNVINSFEDGQGNVVVDIIAYDSPDILDQVIRVNLRLTSHSLTGGGQQFSAIFVKFRRKICRFSPKPIL